MRRSLAIAVAVLLPLAATARAQDAGASAAEVEKINAAIGEFNCGPADEVEKETADLFELDDVACKTAQYDIKLDGEFKVISMTYDGPIDD